MRALLEGLPARCHQIVSGYPVRFDRILLNGLIQSFQRPERVVGLFTKYRRLYPVSQPDLRPQGDELWIAGNLRQLAEPTRLSNGKRISELTLDHPRQRALMHAPGRFAHKAAGDTFTTRNLHEPAARALETTTDHYRLASPRCDLSQRFGDPCPIPGRADRLD